MKIVDTDAFLDMPQSAQVLYFHLVMRADDDGFVSNPKKIMRVVGSQEDDYRILIAKRFLIKFESGVCVIKHWLIHNLIRQDRYTETTYIDEKAKLSVKGNKSYTENDNVIPVGNQCPPQVRLGLGKVSISKGKEKQITVDELWNEMIEEFKAKYAPSLIAEFEDHWRAKNAGGKKERWEMEKVFDMSRRLSTWKRKADKWQFEKEQKHRAKVQEEKPAERVSSGFKKMDIILSDIDRYEETRKQM